MQARAVATATEAMAAMASVQTAILTYLFMYLPFGSLFGFGAPRRFLRRQLSPFILSRQPDDDILQKLAY